jgi:arsenate reductase (glutaredoxin)
MKIYHNPRCRKSRETLEILKTYSKKITVVEYLKTPPSKIEIKQILQMLNIEAKDLIRKGEPEFKENYKGKELTEDEWIDAMVKFPKLIERPIVVSNNKAVIGRPPENVRKLL